MQLNLNPTLNMRVRTEMNLETPLLPNKKTTSKKISNSTGVTKKRKLSNFHKAYMDKCDTAMKNEGFECMTPRLKFSSPFGSDENPFKSTKKMKARNQQKGTLISERIEEEFIVYDVL